MKKWKVLLMSAALAAAFAACGGGEQTPVNGEESNVAGESAGAGDASKEEAAKGYVFVYQGVSISADALAAPIVETLGEPVSYFEAASCAFEGLDKMYTYNSVEIDTYPDAEGADRVSSIILKDDMVETPEGVSLFETKADMIAAYGENYKEENGLLVYEKDGMKLCFILENDEIVSIEYMSTVLE
ncbi:MAG: hypothetical protein IJ282_07805 [Lachnospiraceae bacterium]|nr:hypothetical protein [Lachnospiraceae bacterium]